MKNDAPDQVEAWLLSLLKSSNNNIEKDASYSPNRPPVSLQNNDEFIVDSTAYLRVLEAYASIKNYSGAPQKAEFLLNNLIRHYDAAVKLYESTYNIKYDAQSPQHYIQSNDQLERSAAAAAAVVQSLQPTVECYNAVIEAWSNSNEQISVVRSRTWLSKLEDQSTLFPLLQPNAKSYDLYLNSVSRGIGKNAKLHLERAEEAMKILQYRLSSDAPSSIRPTTESFNYVLRAYTRCRNEKSIADKVMGLVRDMEKIQKENTLNQVKRVGGNNKDDWKMNVSPNTKTYVMAMDAWIIKAGVKATKWRSEQLARNNQLKQKGVVPNDSENDTNKKKDDGTKEMEFAKSILVYIQALEKVGLADVRASVVGYNTLLSGYVRLANELRPDIPMLCEQLLNEMMDANDENSNIYPDVTSFNAVIKAWGKTKRKNSAARCEYWLRKMIAESQPNSRSSRYGGGDEQIMRIAQPNTKTYNLVMDAWLQMDEHDAARVQDLLLEMKHSDIVSPDSESYSKTIRAWLMDELHTGGHVGIPGSSVEKAWEWLKELMHLEGSGGVGSPAPELFTTILKTAARSEGRGENLLAVAQSVFFAKRNQSRFDVDSIDFVFLLEVGMKVLRGQERDQFLLDLLKQSSKDGLLSKRFVKEAVSGPKYEEWPEEERQRIAQMLFGVELSIPSSWSRNVQDNARPCVDDVMIAYFE
jgi:tetratricopeptide (TPR) repeat protein